MAKSVRKIATAAQIGAFSRAISGRVHAKRVQVVMVTVPVAFAEVASAPPLRA
jgi:hypothetical protein